MFYPFTIGSIYRRRDVYRVIGIPEDTRGGNWDTGYARHDNDWFVFANIGVAGRTGHDYPNAWDGPHLLWYGKNHTTRHQPAIQNMLSGRGQVYIFTRIDQNLPFVFVGCGTPTEVWDTSPVSVRWALSEPAYGAASVQPALSLVRESLSESVYAAVSIPPDEEEESRSLPEARERILQSIARRRGQPGFRYNLLSAYQGRCCISETNVPEALEAAHIIPYHRTQTNDLTNGLLLRADIHTLFDLGKLAIDSRTMQVILSPRLHDSAYAPLAGRELVLPGDTLLRPDKDALDQHRDWAQL